MQRNWKTIQPTGLLHAFRLCKDYARERNNLSVERIAELMGITPDLLYKWLGTGKMPANLIPTYEHICNVDFVSRWLSISAGKMVISLPSGRQVQAVDVHQLQGLLNDAVGLILNFAAGKATPFETLAAIHAGMAGLAWHKANVEKHATPEFQFGEDE